jgi:hypothetical protein
VPREPGTGANVFRRSPTHRDPLGSFVLVRDSPFAHEVKIVEGEVRAARVVNPSQRLTSAIYQPQIDMQFPQIAGTITTLAF